MFKRQKFIIFFIMLMPAVSFASNTEIVLGVGHGSFAWCGGNGDIGMGGWRQEPLPYSDHRRTGTYLMGLRYNVSPSLAIDGLYHTWTDVSVSGVYVDDADYNPKTRQVRAGAPMYNASMRTKTDGVSLSVVPIAHLGQTRIFGRVGMLLFRQSTEFSYQTNTTPALREAGRRSTAMLGAGIGQDFGRWNVSLEAQAFQQVKIQEAPVGGDWANDKSFGLVSYMITTAYRF